jgi:hypothetical protein
MYNKGRQDPEILKKIKDATIHTQYEKTQQIKIEAQTLKNNALRREFDHLVTLDQTRIRSVVADKVN